MDVMPLLNAASSANVISMSLSTLLLVVSDVKVFAGFIGISATLTVTVYCCVVVSAAVTV